MTVVVLVLMCLLLIAIVLAFEVLMGEIIMPLIDEEWEPSHGSTIALVVLLASFVAYQLLTQSIFS